MKNTFFRFPSILLLLLLTVLLPGFKPVKTYSFKWTSLFNGKDLSGWDTYLGPVYDPKINGFSGAAIGLNNDPNHVFSVVQLADGDAVIHITGENFGALVTKNEFKNYHLQLQFKWGNKTWANKKGKKMDSGLLYHSVGKNNADNGFWMRSQEFQIEEGNCGDYWGCADAFNEINAIRKSDSEYVYHPQGISTVFSAHTKEGRRCIKKGDAEKPAGEWNTLDLYCYDDASIHVVNGKVMMVLNHSQQWDNGKSTPLVKGKIQLQSEGAEIYYKEIKIMPINQLPVSLIK